ncbi:hypothetical protein LJR230_004123 [Trinickia sp. LjRoot230]|uniref:hypothetical protein n=1 Tax=Trinickia sp. LjRoot230 TaxID=3342288 RepID=UPI003ED15D38
MINRVGGPGTPEPGQPEEIKGAGEAAGTATPAAQNAALQKLEPGDAKPRGTAPVFSAPMADILAVHVDTVTTLDGVRTALGQQTWGAPPWPTIESVPYSQQMVLLKTVALRIKFIVEVHTFSNDDVDGPLTNDRYLRYRATVDVLLAAITPYRKANQPVPTELIEIYATLHVARAYLSDEENAAIDAAIEAAGFRPETR